MFICNSNQMKYCTVVCVIFLFVCLVTIFLFWIFEPRARRVSVIIISSVVCVVVFIYILRPIVGFPPLIPLLLYFFFLQKNKTKQKWICYYSASVCESDCLKYFCFLWEIALECRQKQSNGYRLLIIMVRNPTLPAIFFFSVCVCVIVFECLAML